ncbi:hypothetical protein EYF80_012517 [Liparis tanakae]|uniref:Uncharacterized protein n=1 Tax=Liparis tanakae TaxID=230148 RepID=A0A4Z2IGY0_9TELE|nr:hypothetical protein EYF80_012517 [Liparis tanakae]
MNTNRSTAEEEAASRSGVVGRVGAPPTELTCASVSCRYLKVTLSPSSTVMLSGRCANSPPCTLETAEGKNKTEKRTAPFGTSAFSNPASPRLHIQTPRGTTTGPTRRVRVLLFSPTQDDSRTR